MSLFPTCLPAFHLETWLPTHSFPSRLLQLGNAAAQNLSAVPGQLFACPWGSSSYFFELTPYSFSVYSHIWWSTSSAPPWKRTPGGKCFRTAVSEDVWPPYPVAGLAGAESLTLRTRVSSFVFLPWFPVWPTLWYKTYLFFSGSFRLFPPGVVWSFRVLWYGWVRACEHLYQYLGLYFHGDSGDPFNVEPCLPQLLAFCIFFSFFSTFSLIRLYGLPFCKKMEHCMDHLCSLLLSVFLYSFLGDYLNSIWKTSLNSV